MNPENPSGDGREVTKPAVNPETIKVVELSPEQAAQAEYWLAVIAEEEAARKLTEKSPEQAEVERATAELETIFADWLVPEKLDQLNALTTPAEAMANPLRAEAKATSTKIWSLIKALGSSLPSEEIARLTDRRMILARAIGVINNGRVDHTRG